MKHRPFNMPGSATFNWHPIHGPDFMQQKSTHLYSCGTAVARLWPFSRTAQRQGPSRPTPNRAPAPWTAWRQAAVLVWLVLLNTALVTAQEYKAPSITDLYGTPKQQNTTTTTEAPQESTPQRQERPNSLYPNLRANNLSTRVVVETPTQVRPPEKVIPAKQEMSDFEILVQQSLGVALPVFADNLFQSPQASFNIGDQVNVPSDFVIGPGDDIIVRAWGSIELEYAVTVDRQGHVFIPKVGSIPLAGLTYKELQPVLKQAMGRVYKSFDLSVTMGTLRSIRLYVTGFARKPGTYQVNSLSSLISALFVTGGAAANGSLRNIELRRGQQRISQLDLYDFLLNGNRSADMRLQNEDVIHIPPMQGQVAIAGSIRNAAIYQFKSGMTLADLLQISGGTTSTADGLRIKLERIAKPENTPQGQTTPTATRIVEELDFGPQAMQTVLRDGDLVVLVPISPQFNNAVTLKGQVALPLRHAWRQGLRVSDIIPDVNALISPTYWIEKNSQNKIASFLTDPANIKIQPTFPEINWEYAVVERVLNPSLQVTLIPFELGKVVFHRDPQHNLQLQPGDTITVFSRNDFRGPLEQRTRFVKIEGEVMRPGMYTVQPGDTLRTLFEKAGGLTRLGYLYGTQLFRESVRQQQQRRMDDAINAMERDFAKFLIERSRETVANGESETITAEKNAVQSFLDNLRKLKPEGRMILELDSQTRTPAQLPPLRLENNDSLFVPPIPETVEVMGAVMAERSFLWQKNRDAEDYITLAGGRRSTARSTSAIVIRPDGTLVSDEQMESGGIAPGDTIWVEENTESVSWTRRLKDISQIIYQFGMGIAGIRIVKGM
jgi:protein involved in polysaccharide export with SLBB domain